ncbi:MAG TPA: ATP-dependent 6-phosphofructokinase [Candidatus Acidoferrum sp.]|nr:ATP-dependent 6-phosphofructokinase [Candidatus Acidoferrum sp.]
MKKIGIINSGGDCPGINAVISSIVKTGTPMGYECIGFERGWEGLLDPLAYIALTPERVRGISHLGGTILHTVNKGRFAGKIGSGDMSKIDPEVLAMAKRNADSLGLDGLIVIGGDGTLSAAVQLADYGLRIVGVPKTIDNDLSATDKTFGFSTAVQVAVDAFDKIHTTATSQDRTFFIECMGRHSGMITLFAGFAAGADAILLPEFPIHLDEFIDYLRNRQRGGRGSAIVAVSEGVKLPNQGLTSKSSGSSSEVVLGGASEKLMHLIEEAAPGEFEMRNVVLGHTQRGGDPMSQDRILAKRYGIEAMLAYDRGETNVMVAVTNHQMKTVPIADAVGSLKLVTHDTLEYKDAKRIGIYVNY